MHDMLTWLALAVCVTQSAMLSGLNLAVFSVSRLRLEAAAGAGDPQAARLLALRRDAHYTLVTILLANVAVNVLLTLLAESLLPAIGAFLFSTVVITAFGEIAPQAYFTRHALRVVAILSPLLRLYQLLLWPVAKPAGVLLDRWVGAEAIPWFREAELRDVLRHHAHHDENEVCRFEAIGAMNFLALDDLPIGAVGAPLEERSILSLPVEDDLPVLPPFERSPDDPFLRRLSEPGTSWMVITDGSGEPRFVVDVDRFLRDALLSDAPVQLAAACHRPLVVRDDRRPVGTVMGWLAPRFGRAGGGRAKELPVLVWAAGSKRIVTGTDILARLFEGASDVQAAPG